MFVSCVYVCVVVVVVVVRDLFDGPITRPGKSYRCGVSECDREASTLRRSSRTGGLSSHEEEEEEKKKKRRRRRRKKDRQKKANFSFLKKDCRTGTTLRLCRLSAVERCANLKKRKMNVKRHRRLPKPFLRFIYSHMLMTT